MRQCIVKAMVKAPARASLTPRVASENTSVVLVTTVTSYQDGPRERAPIVPHPAERPIPRFTHVANELAPYHVVGGLGIAVGRLVEQLAAAGARSRVLTGATERLPTPRAESWGEVVPLPCIGHDDERIASLTELALHEVTSHANDDEVLVAHDDEAAALLVHARRRGVRSRLVYWLHSLYDRPAGQLPARLRRGLAPGSLGASALAAADLVVTSPGILADASSLAWPSPLDALQEALLHARERGATLALEASLGLLAQPPTHVPPPLPSRPRVVFASRPSVHKGVGFFLALAARLGHLDVDFIATGDPGPARIDMTRPGASRIRWVGWLQPAELVELLRSASCVVAPSLSEGFGLGAAEVAQLGVPLLYHDIGGLRSLPPSPTTVAVALDPSERVACYQTWAELQTGERAQLWAAWDRAAPRLASLVERWVAQVEHVLTRGVPEPARAAGPTPRLTAPSWGRALVDRMR
jgi:glycosyltransferase involved in cell wall biosynthesis